ncbi:MAG TPA: FAD-dependent oxidoreductase [Gammaproteobacteria bacterium]|nr:FAD-dependent oxidoreductase [Gammaproteobacteria bacterium]
MSDPVIIIGSGVGGYTVAREWRKRDKETALMIISADGAESYSKPMLSNALDKGKPADSLVMADAEKMADNLNADIRSRVRLESINPAQHSVSTTAGEFTYSKLVLSMGANPIRLVFKGNAANEVLSVNNLDDYRLFRDQLQGKKQVTIIGAGLIGCEFANDLCNNDIKVQVIDLSPQPLGRLLPEKMADAVKQSLADLGVCWYLGKSVSEINTHDSGYRLTLDDGSLLDTELILSAVGLQPVTELAATAGFDVQRGIVVNRKLQTSDSDVYALGDCAEVEGLVLPFILPLMNAARTLAANLAGDDVEVSYPAMPVAVKTPAIPLVICPPSAGSQGIWTETDMGVGIQSLCHSPSGDLLGFALSGATVSKKTELAKQIAHWL